MPDFQPLHNAHAIDQVAFGVTFQNPLSDANLQAARNAIGNPEELPGRMELHQIAIAIGPVGTPAAPGPKAGPPGGIAYTKTQADGGLESELQLLRNSMVFRTSVYTRWVAVWERTRNYFSRVMAMYAGCGLAQVSLNYLDKFICYTSVGEARVATILQPNSLYLAPRIFETDDLWHCYSGAFSRVNEFTKRLTSVNVDYVSETVLAEGRDRQTLGITTVLNDIFNQPGYTPFQPPADELMGTVDRAFQGLHEADKGILRAIISPAMARRIALEG